VIDFLMAVAQVAASSALPSQSNPVGAFLQAADQNQFASMEALIGGVTTRDGRRLSAADFIAKVRPCYLRRVYKNNAKPEILAAWMCDEGQNRSRVMIVNVAEQAGRVQLQVQLEQSNDRPAPARAGSAFTDSGAH
jgi:hypothetical protein